MKTVVIALGGNAIMPKGKMTINNEFHLVRDAVLKILPLVKKYNVVITHGNGPQVGNILIRVEEALGKAYPIPLSVAVAESEGELGYIIEQCLVNAMLRHGVKKPVISMLSQVLVDRKDPAFRNPAKPVGPFYTEGQAKEMKKKGLHVHYEEGKGWRRVVPSPRPLQIVESRVIKEMVGKAVIIAAGGGGIPVIKEKGAYRGIDAVIDKDLASACLAKSIGAHYLLILTDVPCAYKNYLQNGEMMLKRLSVRGAQKLIDEECFGSGTMLPKIQASVDFAKSGGKAVITNMENAQKAMKGKAGTIITK